MATTTTPDLAFLDDTTLVPDVRDDAPAVRDEADEADDSDDTSDDVADDDDDVASCDDEPFDGFRTDAEADADVLASAGWGTDEDYGYAGGDD